MDSVGYIDTDRKDNGEVEQKINSEIYSDLIEIISNAKSKWEIAEKAYFIGLNHYREKQ